MKCPKCGNENKEGAKFCRKCGAELKEQEKTVNQEKEETVKTEADKKQTPKKETKKETEKKESSKEEEKKVESSTKTESEDKKEEPKEATPEKKKGGAKKTFIKILILLIIVAIGVGGYFIYDKFFYPYEAKVEENLDKYFETSDEKYLDKIQDIMSKYSDDQETLKKIEEVSKQKVEKWIEDKNSAQYKDEENIEKEFTNIEKKLDKLKKANAIKKEDYEKYVERIQNLKESKKSYLDGTEKYESKNYDKAYASFAEVIEEDKLYESAQEYLEKCVGDTIATVESEYKTKTTIPEGATAAEIKAKYVDAYEYLIQQNEKTNIDLNSSETYQKLISESMTKIIEDSVNIIKENIKNKEYTTAKTNITELLGYISKVADKKEYDELIKTSLTNITDITVTTADSLIGEYAYSEAKQLLADVKTELSSLKSANSYIKILDDKVTQINDKMPISLLELTTRSKDSSISLRNNSFKDADGNQYEKGITLYSYGQGSYNCTYNLNGNYKKLKAKYGVCAANSSNDVSAYIKIYGDDKLLYTSNAIRWDSLPQELDVNISGVQMLKIEFVYDDLDRDVFIGNPELYK